MVKKKSGFDKAYEELQEIVEELQSEEISIDQLGDKLKRAKELLKLTKEKLRNVELEINSILESE